MNEQQLAVSVRVLSPTPDPAECIPGPAAPGNPQEHILCPSLPFKYHHQPTQHEGRSRQPKAVGVFHKHLCRSLCDIHLRYFLITVMQTFLLLSSTHCSLQTCSALHGMGLWRGSCTWQEQICPNLCRFGSPAFTSPIHTACLHRVNRQYTASTLSRRLASSAFPKRWRWGAVILFNISFSNC